MYKLEPESEMERVRHQVRVYEDWLRPCLCDDETQEVIAMPPRKPKIPSPAPKAVPEPEEEAPALEAPEFAWPVPELIKTDEDLVREEAERLSAAQTAKFTAMLAESQKRDNQTRDYYQALADLKDRRRRLRYEFIPFACWTGAVVIAWICLILTGATGSPAPYFFGALSLVMTVFAINSLRKPRQLLKAIRLKESLLSTAYPLAFDALAGTRKEPEEV